MTSLFWNDIRGQVETLSITKTHNHTHNMNQEINVAGKVGINDNDYYDPNVELEKLKQFIKNCFKEHKKGQ